ncbi:MAG: SAM-dependent chlorinase/fluorinase [Kiritimatiellae bacterium]|nr:SAM-dependent chlorinase/fluorinase [Kiritimatiellia bacterium]
MKIVTFLTDFGTVDGYVAAMKGVVVEACPSVQLVDTSHDVPPQNIRAGAWTLRYYWNLFPKGTIHVAVVDPGVGSRRKPLLVNADGRWLIGPDNGLFSWVFETAQRWRAYRIRPTVLRPDAVGQTFQGRDIFAYAAGLLAAGASRKDLADSVVKPIRFDWPKPNIRRRRILGEIIHVDRFGNVISNIPVERVDNNSQTLLISCNQLQIKKLSQFYTSAPGGSTLALCGSSGLLELSVNQGNVAELYGISLGDAVEVRW